MTLAPFSPKRLSDCCQKPAKVNVNDPGGSLFCSHCGNDCNVSNRKAPFRGYSTLSTVRKATGESEVFLKVWERCKGKSEVSGEDLLPYGHKMWHWQFCHLLPKGSYQGDRLDPINIVATTVTEHTEEWPFVKERTDEELREDGRAYWIPKVTLFRALRLKYNQRLNAELSGKA